MIKKFNDLQQLNTSAAQLFIQAANDAIAKKGNFTVALTGGSSPVGLYQLLAASPYREQVQWDQVYVFWGDERWVPLNDERSNARMAFETLLDHVPISRGHIFPMWADTVSPEEFARQYEQALKLHLGADGIFDLILLGMGADGHTASWFPHTAVVHEYDKWVVAYFLKAQEMHRITLTVPLINRAKQMVVITYGESKSDALYEVLEGARNPEKYPAQLLEPIAGEVIWIVDEAAAAKLSSLEKHQ
ncbi:6-phosphogluconolactonase [Parapedobacter tibetensis]|uniref:6-phosphogluconolactonase n=1 Tax=Parapedobacter tibetensis TaxID=2972951 RepID=UPI00214DBA07|nr:6-phosphogluconolactonase [Parapedobacter tibetensis]